MENVVFWYLLMTLIQVYHIFEEIALGSYKFVGSLNKYLIATSGLISPNFILLSLILLNLKIGYILGIIGTFMAMANRVVHLGGYLKTKSYRDTAGAGVFTGILLAIVGFIVFYQLIRIIR